LMVVVMMVSSSFSVNPSRSGNTSDCLEKKAALLAIDREETESNRSRPAA
jgi:hypothetical protein